MTGRRFYRRPDSGVSTFPRVQVYLTDRQLVQIRLIMRTRETAVPTWKGQGRPRCLRENANSAGAANTRVSGYVCVPGSSWHRDRISSPIAPITRNRHFRATPRRTKIESCAGALRDQNRGSTSAVYIYRE